ncbi:MAG: hypothetical protein Q8O67_09380 [Deltaproteobacteria bacterium]|nr:hypothetical protein [Deltaproteobacteria bacterium]
MKAAVVVVVVALAVAAFGIGLWRGQQIGEATTAASLKIDEDSARVRQARAQEDRRNATEEHARLQASLESLRKAVGDVEAIAAADARAQAETADAGVVVDVEVDAGAPVVDAGSSP